jgi:hypothetical protein
MAGVGMKMSILVPNIKHFGQKDLTFKTRHKAYACTLSVMLEDTTYNKPQIVLKCIYQK